MMEQIGVSLLPASEANYLTLLSGVDVARNG